MSRALYLAATASPGGDIVVAQERRALEACFDDVVTLTPGDLLDGEYGRLYGGFDIPFLADYFATAAQIEAQPEEPFDLVHCYSGTWSSTICLLSALGARVTYTSPAHDRQLTVEEFAAQGLIYPYPHISDDRLWRHFSRGLRLADVVIAPSTHSQKVLEAEGCSRVEVIPHGVDLPAEVPALPSQFRVGYLGATGPDKGLVYLLRAWEQLDIAGAELVLAGAGTEQLASLVQREISHGQIVLLGHVAAATDLYAACSVYVQPSVTEAFGIEVLEAMAHGRPVIVSENCGAADVVTDGWDGFVVPARDPGAIAEKVKQLDTRLAETMGEAARETAAQYTWEKVRGQYEQLWRELCQK